MKLISLCIFLVTVGIRIESDDDELRGGAKTQLAAESDGTYADEVNRHIIGKAPAPPAPTPPEDGWTTIGVGDCVTGYRRDLSGKNDALHGCKSRCLAARVCRFVAYSSWRWCSVYTTCNHGTPPTLNTDDQRLTTYQAPAPAYDINAGAKCKSGYSPLTDSWQKCKSAAEWLGLSAYVRSVGFVPMTPFGTNRPQGCFQSTSLHRPVHFNTGVGGHSQGTDKIICQKDLYEVYEVRGKWRYATSIAGSHGSTIAYTLTWGTSQTTSWSKSSTFSKSVQASMTAGFEIEGIGASTTVTEAVTRGLTEQIGGALGKTKTKGVTRNIMSDDNNSKIWVFDVKSRRPGGDTWVTTVTDNFATTPSRGLPPKCWPGWCETTSGCQTCMPKMLRTTISLQTGSCPTGYTWQSGVLASYGHCEGSTSSSHCILDKAQAQIMCDAHAECAGVAETSNAGWLGAHTGMVAPGRLPVTPNSEWASCVKASR